MKFILVSIVVVIILMINLDINHKGKYLKIKFKTSAKIDKE